MKSVFVLLLFLASCVSAQTAIQSGNIDDPATFGGSLPDCADGTANVAINPGVTLTVDVPCNVASMTHPQGATLVISTGSRLEISGQNVVYTVGGTLVIGCAQLMLSGAQSAWMKMGAAATAPYPLVETAGTSINCPALISNNGFGLACISPGGTTTQCSSAGWGKTSNWNVSFLNFDNLGDATHNGVVIAGTPGMVQTFNNVIWSNNGTTFFGDLIDSTSGISVTNSAWEGSKGAYSWTGAAAQTSTNTAPREFINTVTDISPKIGNGNLYIYNNYFDSKWAVSGAGKGMSAVFEFNLDRDPTVNQPSQLPGVESYNYFLKDYWPTATVTSTVTAATLNTLTDATQGWTRNAFCATTANGWMVYTVSGTGADQLRLISCNTANTLTVTPVWDTIPDSSTQYAIYDGIGNVHLFAPNPGVHTGDVGEFTGAYGTGKVFLNSNLSGPITVSYTLTIPNGAGTNSAALFSFGTATAANTVTALHNTIYTGSFVGAYVDDYSDNHAMGYIAAYEDSLFWTYASHVSNNQCGSVKIEDNQFCKANGPLNYGLPSAFDYNGGWNLNPGSYFGNGYSINLSGQAGQNDVNLPPDDGPDFVDATRNFVSWCKSMGVTTGTRPQIIAACRYQLLHAHDFNGFGNPTFNPLAFYNWVRAGFAPQNILLHAAASDGTDIGAVPYSAP